MEMVHEIVPQNGELLILPSDKGRKAIHTGAIIRIAAISNYSKLYFNTGKTLVVAKVLRWFEERLPAHEFIRTHRTHLINKSFIYDTNADVNKVQLVNGEWLEVARRKRNNFIRRWQPAQSLRKRKKSGFAEPVCSN